MGGDLLRGSGACGVKERPILFSGPMVRAILEGRKTQTRRIVKPQPHYNGTYDVVCENHYLPPDTLLVPGGGVLGYDVRCPYGERGDLLWVRETWAHIWPTEDQCAPGCSERSHIEYRADSGNRYPGEWPDDMGDDYECPRWRPSIHMPRWASRITLHVTSVRVAPLKSITEEEAIAEGCSGTDPEPKSEGGTIFHWEGVSSKPSPLAHFAHLWDQINRARAPWASNPWVWVVGFERVEVQT